MSRKTYFDMSDDERRELMVMSTNYRELKTWQIQCGGCGVYGTVQSVEKPDSLPDSWHVVGYGIRCSLCAQIEAREGN